MNDLEYKIEEIIQKTGKILEQNKVYKEIVLELKNRLKNLEIENKELKSLLKEEKDQTQQLSFDKESVKEQLDKFIAELDMSINMLSELD
jgi:hypothetical protein